MSRISIHFNLRGQAAGQVVWRRGRSPLIRYNLAMAELQPEIFLKETVPHEVAHVITRQLYPKAKPHGREWRVVMQYLGVEQPQRCHGFNPSEPAARRQRRWRYRCDCRTHQISTTRHNRIQNNHHRYLCRRCGSELRQ